MSNSLQKGPKASKLSKTVHKGLNCPKGSKNDWTIDTKDDIWNLKTRFSIKLLIFSKSYWKSMIFFEQFRPKWQGKRCHQSIGKHVRNWALVKDLLKSYCLLDILASRQYWRWGRGRRRGRASSCRWFEHASRRPFLLQAGCVFPHGTWWGGYIL